MHLGEISRPNRIDHGSYTHVIRTATVEDLPFPKLIFTLHMEGKRRKHFPLIKSDIKLMSTLGEVMHPDPLYKTGVITYTTKGALRRGLRKFEKALSSKKG